MVITCKKLYLLIYSIMCNQKAHLPVVDSPRKTEIKTHYQMRAKFTLKPVPICQMSKHHHVRPHVAMSLQIYCLFVHQ